MKLNINITDISFVSHTKDYLKQSSNPKFSKKSTFAELSIDFPAAIDKRVL
jgi:hypothetical protein